MHTIHLQGKEENNRTSRNEGESMTWLFNITSCSKKVSLFFVVCPPPRLFHPHPHTLSSLFLLGFHPLVSWELSVMTLCLFKGINHHHLAGHWLARLISRVVRPQWSLWWWWIWRGTYLVKPTNPSLPASVWGVGKKFQTLGKNKQIVGGYKIFVFLCTFTQNFR